MINHGFYTSRRTVGPKFGVTVRDGKEPAERAAISSPFSVQSMVMQKQNPILVKGVTVQADTDKFDFQATNSQGVLFQGTPSPDATRQTVDLSQADSKSLSNASAAFQSLLKLVSGSSAGMTMGPPKATTAEVKTSVFGIPAHTTRKFESHISNADSLKMAEQTEVQSTLPLTKDIVSEVSPAENMVSQQDAMALISLIPQEETVQGHSNGSTELPSMRRPALKHSTVGPTVDDNVRSNATSSVASVTSESLDELGQPQNALTRYHGGPLSPPPPESIRVRLSHYGIGFIPSRYPLKKAKTLNALLKKQCVENARQLRSIMNKSFNTNIVLTANDPALTEATIESLQDELGYKIPVMDFQKFSEDRRYPVLNTLISYYYSQLRSEAKVPSKKPLVLYLKHANQGTLDRLSSEEYVKHLFKDRNVRLIVAPQIPSTVPYAMIAPKSHKQGFVLHKIPSLKPLEWNPLLAQSSERERFEQKYGYTLDQGQLNRLLYLLLIEHGGPPDKAKILDTLDSLGAYLKAHENKGHQGKAYEYRVRKGKVQAMHTAGDAIPKAGLKTKGPRVIKEINDQDLMGFFKEHNLLDQDPNRTQFSFELKHDLERVIGLDAPKQVLQTILDHFKYPDISGRILRGRPLVKTMIMYGPPGVGKTLFAEGAAKELEKETSLPVTYISRKGGDFCSNSHPGAVGEAAEEFFNEIENAPTPMVVAFVDEVDGMYNREDKDRANPVIEKDMTDGTETFMIKLQHLKNNSKKKVLLLFATNNMEKLDKAMKDRTVYKAKIDLPNEDAWRQILENEFKDSSIQYDESTLAYALNTVKKADYSARGTSAFVERMQDEAFHSMPNKQAVNKSAKNKPDMDIPLELTREVIDKAYAAGMEIESEEALHEKLRKDLEKRELRERNRQLTVQEQIPTDELERYSKLHSRELALREKSVAVEEGISDAERQRKRELELQQLALQERRLPLETKAVAIEEGIPDSERERKRAMELKQFELSEKDTNLAYEFRTGVTARKHGIE